MINDVSGSCTKVGMKDCANFMNDMDNAMCVWKC